MFTTSIILRPLLGLEQERVMGQDIQSAFMPSLPDLRRDNLVLHFSA